MLIFEDFLTRGMKKFSYLKTTAHSEIVFLYDLTKQYFYFEMPFFNYILKKINMQHFHEFFSASDVARKSVKIQKSVFP